MKITLEVNVTATGLHSAQSVFNSGVTKKGEAFALIQWYKNWENSGVFTQKIGGKLIPLQTLSIKRGRGVDNTITVKTKRGTFIFPLEPGIPRFREFRKKKI